ncbi:MULTISPECIES: hypothetical protein [Novosphingobium]|nr:hypothetical protein [Novosphingobium resinovorum]
MKHDLSADLRRERRAVLRLYSASFMSNTKWRSVFTALENDGLGIRQLVIKFIEAENEKAISLPWLNAPHAFVDSIDFGPFPLVGIEWMEVPAVAIFPRKNNVPAEHYPQDIAAVRSALLALGRKLPLEDTSTGLRIVGHAR